LNTTQLERWQRTIEVVEEDGRRHQMRLFSDRHGERKAAGAPEDVAEVLLSAWWCGGRGSLERAG
jgi:hypothetical protein